MKQRFGIAQALLANPKLIVVDEPTTGLDPAERNRFLNLLSGIRRNVVVILATHIVEDVRELCSRMAIISQGQLLLEGERQQALDALRGLVWRKVVATDAEREATHLLGGLHEVRVYSESSPGEGFEAADSDLEERLLLQSDQSGTELGGAMFWTFFWFELKLRFRSISTYLFLHDPVSLDVLFGFRGRFRADWTGEDLDQGTLCPA
jgi:ABC-type multidrug transport system ATPase subunit